MQVLLQVSEVQRAAGGSGPTDCRSAARRRDWNDCLQEITLQNSTDLVARGASAATAGWAALLSLALVLSDAINA